MQHFLHEHGMDFLISLIIVFMGLVVFALDMGMRNHS